MDKQPITINLNSPVQGLKALNIKDMIETDDELLVTLNNKDCYDINPGQSLVFKRYIYTDSGSNFTLTNYVTVNSEDSDHTIHIEKPSVEKVFLDKSENGIRFISGFTESNGETEWYGYHIIKCNMEHNLFAQDLALNAGQELNFYDYRGNLLGTFKSLAGALKRSDTEATVDDCMTYIDSIETCDKPYKKVDRYLYNFLPEPLSRDSIIIKDFDISISGSMAYFTAKYSPFYYTYINTDSNGKPTELDEYKRPVKHCVLYQDPWWYDVKTAWNKNGVEYINLGDTRSILGIDMAYWNISMALSKPAEEDSLGSDDAFNATYISDLEESLIPPIIDMERLKYSPMVYDSSVNQERYYKWVSEDFTDYPAVYTKQWLTPETTKNGTSVTVYYRDSTTDTFKTLSSSEKVQFDIDFNVAYDGGAMYSLYRRNNANGNSGNYYPTEEVVTNELSVATAITMNFHFRERVRIEDRDRNTTANTNTDLTSGNVYYDSWYIDPDSINRVWWNNMDFSKSAFSKSEFDTFMDENAEVSDLLGFLNFTDNDVYYQKKKVSQSFIRLSFYASTDPLEQKLLYYSTVFLDGGELYGKYIKQLLWMDENGIMTGEETNMPNPNEEEVNLNARVVFCSANTVSGRVDTKLTITNEFDRTKSAEGFNIYLFAEDKNLNLENGEKTIYMKVEFNHAGNGKTIPMIQWPKDSNGNYCALVMDNFIESLYIPIKLIYLDGRYSYYIPSAYKNEDGNIVLVLFEPKMDYQEDSTDGYTGDTNTFLLNGNYRRNSKGRRRKKS